MGIKRILKSCRYDKRLLMGILIIVLLLAILGVEGYIYRQQSQKLGRLRAQLQHMQEMKQKQEKQPVVVKMKDNGLTFEGIYQNGGVLYAVINGHALKPLERIKKFEVEEVTRQAVTVKNMETGEVLSFNLFPKAGSPSNSRKF